MDDKLRPVIDAADQLARYVDHMAHPILQRVLLIFAEVYREKRAEWVESERDG